MRFFLAHVSGWEISRNTLARTIHRFDDEELKSFNGKPKATAYLLHRATEAAVAFGLPLNEFGINRPMAMNHAG